MAEVAAEVADARMRGLEMSREGSEGREMGMYRASAKMSGDRTLSPLDRQPLCLDHALTDTESTAYPVGLSAETLGPICALHSARFCLAWRFSWHFR